MDLFLDVWVRYLRTRTSPYSTSRKRLSPSAARDAMTFWIAVLADETFQP
jgi:hypothetical protein